MSVVSRSEQMTVREAADLLGLSYQMADKLIRQGKLTVVHEVKVGDRVVVRFVGRHQVLAMKARREAAQ